ncbi:hypothetical protein AUK10_04490 [Candidatus Gracilibacteria bacterium CG2_30_37_12]|nr:MAG: hypothetical protein AUK10_04490 [Candidatus Gracilibacteria bacterium CG2_30_37_12]
MDPVSFSIFLTLLLLLIFFAGTEIPLMSISAHVIISAVKNRRFGAATLQKIKTQNERLLMTNLVGTTAVTIAISSFSTIVALDVSNKLALPGELGVTIAMLTVSTIILLFGEITPKILGVRFSNQVAFVVAPIYRVLMMLLFPLNWLIEYFVRFISFVTGAHSSLHGAKMTAEEFEAFIDISHEKGAVESHEHKKIKSILDLSETEASSVMTPRVSVDFISEETTINELCTFFLGSTHSRIPVFAETTDDIDYVVTLREAFEWKTQGFGDKQLKELDLDKIIKVPSTQPIDRIFTIFQKSHKHIALVIDEHGGVDGVITLEDIIEEVFGDIKDENDKEEEYIRRTSNGAIIVQGSVLVEDVLEEYGLTSEKVNIDEEYIGETISYLILSLLERFPKNGESLTLNGAKDTLVLTVEDIEDEKIESIRVERI